MKSFGAFLLGVGAFALIALGVSVAVTEYDRRYPFPPPAAVVLEELPPAPPEPEPVQPVAPEPLPAILSDPAVIRDVLSDRAAARQRVGELEALLEKQHEIIVEVQTENDRLRKLLDIEQKASTP